MRVLGGVDLALAAIGSCFLRWHLGGSRWAEQAFLQCKLRAEWAREIEEGMKAAVV